MESYNFKLINSGLHIETYEYKDKEVKVGFKRGIGGFGQFRQLTEKQTEKLKIFLGDELYQDYKKHEGNHLVNEPEAPSLFNQDRLAQEKEDQRKHKAQSSSSRTRNEMRRLINANPELLTFLTLTFKENISDIQLANKIFNRFIVRIRKEDENFKYIAVIEFQKRGAVHYHLLCNLDIKNLADATKRRIFKQNFSQNQWKNGFVKVKEVEHVDNMGAYFCKYLSKDMFDERMFRKKKYFCSQNLNRPIELKGEEAKSFFSKISENAKLLFEKELSSKWVGKVEYRNFKIQGDLDLNKLVKSNNKQVGRIDVLDHDFKF